MPTSTAPFPSGSTVRVRRVASMKNLTESQASSIGLANYYHGYVWKIDCRWIGWFVPRGTKSCNLIGSVSYCPRILLNVAFNQQYRFFLKFGKIVYCAHLISNFAYCYGWDFLIQWAFCYPSLGTFLFSITSFYSAWFGFIRQIVGDDIFPQR